MKSTEKNIQRRSTMRPNKKQNRTSKGKREKTKTNKNVAIKKKKIFWAPYHTEQGLFPAGWRRNKNESPCYLTLIIFDKQNGVLMIIEMIYELLPVTGGQV